jgi:hypothetical protein
MRGKYPMSVRWTAATRAAYAEDPPCPLVIEHVEPMRDLIRRLMPLAGTLRRWRRNYERQTSTACSPRSRTRTCPVARSATRTRGRATTLRALTGPGWRRYHRGASPAARRVSAVERAAQTAGPKVYLFGKMAGPNIHVPRSARAERACSGAAPRGASAWNRAAHERRLSSALIAPSGDQHRR